MLQNPAALPFGPRGLITIKNSQPFPIGVIDRQGTLHTPKFSIFSVYTMCVSVFILCFVDGFSDLFSNCMLPTILSRDQEPCVRSISWSPVGLAPNAGCLLAVCTTQGFVKLYRSPYCDFCAEWIEVYVYLQFKLVDVIKLQSFMVLNWLCILLRLRMYQPSFMIIL